MFGFYDYHSFLAPYLICNRGRYFAVVMGRMLIEYNVLEGF